LSALTADFDGRVTRDHDELDARTRIEILEQIDARAVGQFQIGEHDIGHPPRELHARLAQVARRGRGQPVFHDDRRKRIAGILIVIDYKCVGHRDKKTTAVTYVCRRMANRQSRVRGFRLAGLSRQAKRLWEWRRHPARRRRSARFRLAIRRLRRTRGQGVQFVVCR
jgi:hypothetical protein